MMEEKREKKSYSCRSSRTSRQVLYAGQPLYEHDKPE